MLGNDYNNLYQSAFYAEEVKFFQSHNDEKGLRGFEEKFALANALYTESKKCIGFTSLNPEEAAMTIVGSSDIITTILSNDSSIFEILRDANGTEKNYRPSKRLTSLDAAVIVCEEHLKEIRSM